MMECKHYERGDCRSCRWLELSYEEQLARKRQHLKAQLSGLDLTQLQWLVPQTSVLYGFRNKAKMPVSGAVERPLLGVSPAPCNLQRTADLSDCPLYPPEFERIFSVLKDFIARAGLVPYNVAKQKGELKYILLTQSQYNRQFMLRFVLRSEQKLSLIRRELAGLRAKLPQLAVITANIQPRHAAVLEGEREIFLTERQVLEEQFNRILLFIRPQGFFQTNPQVAAALYRTAQEWIRDLPIRQLWDLFCGVGGFGLHCAAALKEKRGSEVSLTGIEISPSAIYSAGLSAQKLGLRQVKFQSLDAANFALNQSTSKPDLVIVNPPRRGIGDSLAQFLNELVPPFLLYSSCNAVSMGNDLRKLSGYRLQKIRLFDMFPHTAHYEVLTLLVHKA